MDMDLDPRLRGLLGKIGFIAIRNGMYGEAEAVFSGLMALDPSRPGPAIGLGQAYMAGNKLREAEAILDEPAKTDPDARLYLGMAFYLRENILKAREIWEEIAGQGGSRGDSAKAFLAVAREKYPERF